MIGINHVLYLSFGGRNSVDLHEIAIFIVFREMVGSLYLLGSERGHLALIIVYVWAGGHHLEILMREAGAVFTLE